MLAQAGIREIVRGRLAPAYRRPRKPKRGLHGLVNNAGIYQPRTLMETETELFERRTRQSARLLPRHEDRGAIDGAVGRLLNRQHIIRCWSPRMPRRTGIQRYQMGVKGMTKAAAIDLARRKIRVNSVHPGPIDIEMSLAFADIP
jgi:3alpha(or 20beta)-hydroxysteroid dehydrogenase